MKIVLAVLFLFSLFLSLIRGAQPAVISPLPPPTIPTIAAAPLNYTTWLPLINQ